MLWAPQENDTMTHVNGYLWIGLRSVSCGLICVFSYLSTCFGSRITGQLGREVLDIIYAMEK